MTDDTGRDAHDGDQQPSFGTDLGHLPGVEGKRRDHERRHRAHTGHERNYAEFLTYRFGGKQVTRPRDDGSHAEQVTDPRMRADRVTIGQKQDQSHATQRAGAGDEELGTDSFTQPGRRKGHHNERCERANELGVGDTGLRHASEEQREVQAEEQSGGKGFAQCLTGKSATTHDAEAMPEQRPDQEPPERHHGTGRTGRANHRGTGRESNNSYGDPGDAARSFCSIRSIGGRTNRHRCTTHVGLNSILAQRQPSAVGCGEIRYMSTSVLRVANCSGFYGDRLSAAREMVDGGPIDVLTGDWLAELTMFILAKTKASGGGYARTFVTQMEHVLGTCLERGIKVVANAGGLSPAECASAVRDVADRLGLVPKIAWVEGDDVLPRLAELRTAGHDLRHLDTGAAFGDRQPITANAYLGGWGIAEALQRGADIVITGRVTDAAVVVGPAAWHHGWRQNDWNALAGAVVAGHVIECGCQVTGGNYSFFTEVSDLYHPGFPIAEIASDGSTVITKHPGTGGRVDEGTVTAQLLYEIQGTRYLNPDVTTHFDTIRLTDAGPDRVRIDGVIGSAPPSTSKVCINLDGGYRNQMTFCLTGLDIEAKAKLVEDTFWPHQRGGRAAFAETATRLVRSDKSDPRTNDEAVAYLTLIAKDPDERKVGRAFANVGIELALASYPGMFGLGGPSGANAYGVYWPTLLPSALLHHEVHLDGLITTVEAFVPESVDAPSNDPIRATGTMGLLSPGGSTKRVPLGRIIGARSGDKGGNANVGGWVRSDDAWMWLASFLTVDRMRVLMPEADGLVIRRYDLPNIRALNFVIEGLLGDGVASSTRLDPQAKSLGEFLRAKHVDVPAALLSPGITVD